MLTARMLGGFSLLDDKGRDVPVRSRKARGLLSYLMVSGLTGERREKLAGLLWSESSTDQAYDSLRHCLSELRRAEDAAGEPFLQADRQNIRIDRDRVRTDLEVLRSHMASGRIGECRRLLSLPDLSLLAGVETDDPVFDNWLMVERERHGGSLVQDLLAVLRRGNIDSSERIALVQAIEQLDPYQEDAVQIHMELLASEGNAPGATGYFERYRDRLAREYEVEPSEELVELAESLATRAKVGTARKAGDQVEPSLPRAVPSSDRPPMASAPAARAPTIAILWLPAAPGAERLEQLTGAFYHELISTLCRFKEWTVLSSTSDSMIFNGAGRDSLGDLAAMSVDYALLASLAEVSGSTAINIRLMDCASRSVLISDQYPATSENWPSVFNDICCRVASRTQVGIAAARLRNVAGRSPEQRKAYDLWLEGEILTRLWQAESEKRAIELFQKALALDGQLACAYSSWASVLNTRWIICPGWPDDEGDRKRGYELAKRAVTLDPLDCRNQTHLGWCHLLARRFEPGEVHFQLAHDVNPSSPDNLLACGLAASFCGYHDRAKALCDRATALNPFRVDHYWSYRASVELLARNYQACIDAVAMTPDIMPDIQGWAAVAYAHLGRVTEARAALERFYADVRQQWYGKPNPSDADLRRWFVEIFPIKRAEDRNLLAEGLAKIK